MKDHMKLFDECKSELRAIGIAYGRVSRVLVNSRLRSTYGTCRRLANGEFEIAISARLLADSISEQAIKDTMMHELLHTAAPGDHHGKRWRTLAETVNRRLPGYHIRRQTPLSEKGLTPPPPAVPRYLIQCTACGQTYPRQKASELVRYPQKYRCGKCGARLRRIK